MGTESGRDRRRVEGWSGPPRNWPDDVVVPQLSLADRFDHWVDECVTLTAAQKTDEARERYVDILVGLLDAAAAMRATARRDPEEAVDRLRSAVKLLQGVDQAGLEFPAGSGEQAGWKFGT
ncbi:MULTISPECIES: hypothetical protein [Amycolatopsis]|uniref:Uncharacterized protein n=1 Tax=Amycolatopsis albidoflavus TaxID=102226 RepID=A0ABW5HSZ0_9PSEU